MAWDSRVHGLRRLVTDCARSDGPLHYWANHVSMFHSPSGTDVPISTPSLDRDSRRITTLSCNQHGRNARHSPFVINLL
jgi:hypothetical protein